MGSCGLDMQSWSLQGTWDPGPQELLPHVGTGQDWGGPGRGDNSIEKTLMLGKIEGKRRRWQRMRWLDSITDSLDMNLT